MTDADHSALGLPPYPTDLNPIELVWTALKQYVANKNVDLKFKNVETYCDEFFSEYSQEQWKKCYDRAISFEQYFMEQEPALDLEVDQLVINVNKDNDIDRADSIMKYSSSETNNNNVVLTFYKVYILEVGNSLEQLYNADETGLLEITK